MSECDIELLFHFSHVSIWWFKCLKRYNLLLQRSGNWAPFASDLYISINTIAGGEWLTCQELCVYIRDHLRRQRYRGIITMCVLRVCLALLVLCVVLAAGRGRTRRRHGSGPPLPSPAHLCPFGGSLDIEVDQNDDGNSGIVMIPKFPFFGRKYRCLFVSIFLHAE